MIDYTHEVDVQHMEACAERTYTAQEIAEEHNVKAVTVRTRWFDWLLKVAPKPLLKNGKQFTYLAYTLFADFAHVHHSEREAWVREQREHLASEWGGVGVSDCEVMPSEVGTALALVTTNLAIANQSLTAELATVTDFVNQLNASEIDFSEAEVQSWAAAGARKAIAQFKTEEVAHAQTLNALRQQRMQGGQQS